MNTAQALNGSPLFSTLSDQLASIWLPPTALAEICVCKVARTPSLAKTEDAMKMVAHKTVVTSMELNRILLPHFEPATPIIVEHLLTTPKPSLSYHWLLGLLLTQNGHRRTIAKRCDRGSKNNKGRINPASRALGTDRRYSEFCPDGLRDRSSRDCVSPRFNEDVWTGIVANGIWRVGVAHSFPIHRMRRRNCNIRAAGRVASNVKPGAFFTARSGTTNGSFWPLAALEIR